jgi:hypothetical protein
MREIILAGKIEGVVKCCRLKRKRQLSLEPHQSIFPVLEETYDG